MLSRHFLWSGALYIYFKIIGYYDKIYHLFKIIYVLDTFYTLSHLNLTTILEGKEYLQFTVKKAEI